MEARPANAEEVTEMLYRGDLLFSHRLRGLAEALQFQLIAIELRRGEGTRLQMRKSCHD